MWCIIHLSALEHLKAIVAIRAAYQESVHLRRSITELFVWFQDIFKFVIIFFPQNSEHDVISVNIVSISYFVEEAYLMCNSSSGDFFQLDSLLRCSPTPAELISFQCPTACGTFLVLSIYTPLLHTNCTSVLKCNI